MSADWLRVRRGKAPLIVSLPHAGTEIPEDIEQKLHSPWLARKDTDWWVGRLYEFVDTLDATIIATEISRTVIDVNRDPSGTSLYPGQATTGLCPVTTFDGEVLYRAGHEPGAAEIAERRRRYFDPYHRTLADEIHRLRPQSARVVLYDAHSIRSRVPRLFDGILPHFNLGTDNGRTCAPELAAALESHCSVSGLTWIANGRFRGGWTTRHYGDPPGAVHAIQMELACRTYMDEPQEPLGPDNWPPTFDAGRAAKARSALFAILGACVRFANA
jgi:N-formylglutamate deformylase